MAEWTDEELRAMYVEEVGIDYCDDSWWAFVFRDMREASGAATTYEALRLLQSAGWVVRHKVAYRLVQRLRRELPTCHECGQELPERGEKQEAAE